MTDKKDEEPNNQEMFRAILTRIEVLTNHVAAVSMTPDRIHGLRQTILNLSNIYLRTGHPEVRTAIMEIARGFCFVVGEEHTIFFPKAGGAAQVAGAPMGGATVQLPQAHVPQAPTVGPGIQIPGLAPSPYAVATKEGGEAYAAQAPAQQMAAGAQAAYQGQHLSMVVDKDPSGQMGPNGGPPVGTPMTGGPPIAQPQVPTMPPQGASPYAPLPPGAPEMSIDQLASQFSSMQKPAEAAPEAVAPDAVYVPEGTQ